MGPCNYSVRSRGYAWYAWNSQQIWAKAQALTRDVFAEELTLEREGRGTLSWGEMLWMMSSVLVPNHREVSGMCTLHFVRFTFARRARPILNRCNPSRLLAK